MCGRVACLRLGYLFTDKFRIARMKQRYFKDPVAGVVKLRKCPAASFLIYGGCLSCWTSFTVRLFRPYKSAR